MASLGHKNQRGKQVPGLLYSLTKLAQKKYLRLGIHEIHRIPSRMPRPIGLLSACTICVVLQMCFSSLGNAGKCSGNPGKCSSSLGDAGGCSSPPEPSENIAGETNGRVAFWAEPDNEILELTTKFTVPSKLQSFGTLFVWPGIQPGGANYCPIDNGVLQSVLTWGPSCAPDPQCDRPADHSSWWISAQYVNCFGKQPGYTDCQGGRIMAVDANDILSVKMWKSGSTWRQVITNLTTGASVGYDIDMKNQAQKYARFVIEPGEGGSPPASDVIFMDSTITFLKADGRNCRLRERGLGDIVSRPIAINGGQKCHIDKIILKSPIPPTVSGR